MRVQDNAGIYVYYVVREGLHPKEKFYYFPSLNDLCKILSYQLIDNLFVDDFDKIYNEIQNKISNLEYRKLCCYSSYSSYLPSVKFYYVCDQHGNHISKQKILEAFNNFVEERRKKRLSRYHNRRKCAWGHYHNIASVRTRRNDFADEELSELDVNVKYRRKAVTPDNWEVEKFSHNEKCWKTQRKVKHQWDRK